jgi:protein-S-isoprenylcysteine O-methyltransferase Ste14
MIEPVKSLELKIPPPAVAFLTAAGIWGLSRVAPPCHLPAGIRLGVALPVALAGTGFSVAGVTAFSRAKTTINPTKPQRASVLVDSGVYGVTRNPMYLGLLLVLLAWAFFLSPTWAWLGPVAFFLYIGRFQIAPEERVLTALFGAQYTTYQSRVRRWL